MASPEVVMVDTPGVTWVTWTPTDLIVNTERIRSIMVAFEGFQKVTVMDI